MKVTDLIQNSRQTAFSFEILPPVKGNSIQKVYDVIDQLREFDPKYINITSHHSEYVEKAQPDGSFKKVRIRKRPGSVAIASAIQTRYGITAVPHIICKGFTKEETEYALIDLNFLGVYDLLLLRGDVKTFDAAQSPELYHDHATDLQEQVNLFNRGTALDHTHFEPFDIPFSYGMACYPEKHEEAPNMETDIFYAKKKVENGADYLVTQMFFDNPRYYAFVDRLRKEGVTVPVIPGIKPIVFTDQLTSLPRIFRSEIPEPLAAELRKCKDNHAAKTVGAEWSIQQCKDLIAHGAPSLHFYTFMAADSVRRIAKAIY
ncbi:MAG: methylenetetrahydrofolate reductase [Bacteroidales bacterium]|jgi:methylenetetrahydrofolate reductase (NADPH)|nr:methylenetetrahydrofolate reductase [Bacteroidales bacterium]